MITLRVTNTKTWIENCPQQILDHIDGATCYVQDEAVAAVGPRWNISDQEHAWDGYYRFLKRPQAEWPHVPTGLRFIVQWCIEQFQVPFQILDYRARPATQTTSCVAGQIPLFDYQEEAADILEKEPDGVARMSPRAGKTRTLVEVVRRLALPTLWIAPTKGIVTQTVRSAYEFLGDQVVHVTSKNWEEHKDTLLAVTTAGTMLKLPDEFWKTRLHLVGDEVHHYLANKAWGRQMLQKSEHIYHRKGMTGTFFRSRGDDLALLAYMSRVLYSIDSAQLLARGRLVPTYHAWVPIEGPKVRGAKNEFWAHNGHGTLGLAKHSFRNDVVASVAKHLQNKNRTVLILVGTKAQGYAIQKRLATMYPETPSMCEFQHVEFVSTDRKKKTVEAILDSFRGHQEVRILIGTSMIGEGIDLPSADALVFAAGGKAAVTYVQALYRVCTATPGKEYAVVVDFIDRHHPKLLEHSRQRNVVVQGDPVFQQNILSSLDEFVHWSENVWVPQK